MIAFADRSPAPDKEAFHHYLTDFDAVDDEAPLPPERIRNELITLLTAGHETTSNALSWTLLRLSQHPEVARRLRAEVEDVVGDGPVEAQQACAVLQGQAPTPEAIQEAAEVAGNTDIPEPNSDINASAEYRRHLVQVLGRRALTEAFERARAAD